MDLTFDFETYWAKIGGDTHFANRKAAAEREWNSHPEKHRAIIQWLLRHGTYPQRNPFFFIQDFRVQTAQTLSFNAYYERFGTTEEQPSWRRVYLAEQQKTIYVKD